MYMDQRSILGTLGILSFLSSTVSKIPMYAHLSSIFSGVIALVNCYSAKLSATLITILSFMKLLAAALIIAAGLIFHYNKGNILKFLCMCVFHCVNLVPVPCN